LLILKDKPTPEYSAPRIESGDPLKLEKRPSATRVVPKSFSIKNIISGVPAEPEKKTIQNPKEELQTENQVIPLHEIEEEEIVDADTPFDQLELDAAWISFIDSNLREKPKYASLINNYKPILADEYVLQISFENTFQLELFREIKHDLGIYLRKKLNNSIISISETVVEQENSKNKIYTVDDKFRYLSQKNPALVKFKQQLNLDFD